MRIHLILRSYIAAARNERTGPEFSLDALKRETELDEPICETLWDEPAEIAKTIYKVYGYSASEQFRRGIVEQPGRTENLIICYDLRRVYGDLSNVPGFDKNGIFKRERHNDVLIPVFEAKRVVRLEAFSTRQIAKQISS